MNQTFSIILIIYQTYEEVKFLNRTIIYLFLKPGPMVWYQKFEYAVSHWLQKAAENMIGCVLCSPGCFSLFRGSALMDENVMAKYTKIPNKAYQHVQYDQGI